MEEVIKYFESLEARLAAAEERLAANEERHAALEARIAALENEREALLKRVADTETGLHGIQPKLAAIAGHLNRMNEILEEAQLRGLEPDEEKEETVEEETVEEEIVEEPAEEPVVEEEPIAEPEPVVEPEPVAEPELPIEEPVKEEPQPVKEEPVSPNAALYGKAVDDIRQAISLGDRFLFQRELFGQNAEQMQRTLDDLNRLSSFDEAVEYISRFNWDQESNTYQQFLVALHRRFG